MTKKNHIKTSFDLFVNILKLEKDECACELYRANEILEKINQKIKIIKQKIIACEKELREGVGMKGEQLSIGNYELIRYNLVCLDETLEPLLEEENQAKEAYQSILEILQNKTRKHNKVSDKQLIRRGEIELERDKKSDAELDELFAQRQWVNEHG